MTKPLVVVEWDDACCHEEGGSEPTHKPVRMVTAGWLLKEDANGVSLASGYEKEDPESWDSEYFIPAGMVVSMKTVG